MKKLMMILMMFVAVGVSGQNSIVNNSQWNLERYINDCCKELNIDSVTIVIVPCNELIKGKYEGLMIKNNVNLFSVMVYHYLDYNDACLIVSHELVHVHQMITGVLNTTETNEVAFKGKLYNSSKESMIDPYEVEAHSIGLKLYGKYKRIIYSAPPLPNRSF